MEWLLRELPLVSALHFFDQVLCILLGLRVGHLMQRVSDASDGILFGFVLRGELTVFDDRGGFVCLFDGLVGQRGDRLVDSCWHLGFPYLKSERVVATSIAASLLCSA